MHQIALQEQHKALGQVRRHMKKAKERQAKYHDRNAKNVTFEIGDPVFYKNNRTRGKLDAKWKPYYRVIDKTGPVSYVIKNQLDGSTSRVHVEMLRPAKLDWDEIEPLGNENRPMRKTQYVVPPESVSDSESTVDSDEDVPVRQLINRYKRERENSDSEDGIPLMELAKRLKTREKLAKHEVQSQKSESDNESLSLHSEIGSLDEPDIKSEHTDTENMDEIHDDTLSDHDTLQPIQSDTGGLESMDIDQVKVKKTLKRRKSLLSRFVKYVGNKLH